MKTNGGNKTIKTCKVACTNENQKKSQHVEQPLKRNMKKKVKNQKAATH